MPWGNDPTVKPAPQSLREQQVRKGLGAQDVTIAQGRANLAKAPTEQAIAETTLAKARQELRNTPDAPKLTEAQSSNRAYYALMTSGEEAYNKAIAQGYDPGTAENIGATIVDKMFGGIIDSPGDIFRNSASKLGESGKVRFMEGYKRPLSGAAVGEAKQSTELPSMRKTVFPGPLSSKDEQLAINNAQARQDFRRSMGVAGGIPFKSAKPVQAGVTDEAWEKAAEIYNSAPKGANRSRGHRDRMPGLGSYLPAEHRPVRHQPPALLQRVTTPVGLLGGVADDVGKGRCRERQRHPTADPWGSLWGSHKFSSNKCLIISDR